MKTTLFVPDANILIAYLIDESQESERVVAFIDDLTKGKLMAKVPSLFVYEICNRLCRLKDHDRNQSYQLFLKLGRFFPTCALHREVIERAYRITNQYDVAFYDAVYHALAIIEKAVFITLDRKYHEKTRALKSITLLKDY